MRNYSTSSTRPLRQAVIFSAAVMLLLSACGPGEPTPSAGLTANPGATASPAAPTGSPSGALPSEIAANRTERYPFFTYLTQPIWKYEPVSPNVPPVDRVDVAKVDPTAGHPQKDHPYTQGLQNWANDLMDGNFDRIKEKCWWRTPAVMEDRYFSPAARHAINRALRGPVVVPGDSPARWGGPIQVTAFISGAEYECPLIRIGGFADDPTGADVQNLARLIASGKGVPNWAESNPGDKKVFGSVPRFSCDSGKALDDTEGIPGWKGQAVAASAPLTPESKSILERFATGPVRVTKIDPKVPDYWYGLDYFEATLIPADNPAADNRPAGKQPTLLLQGTGYQQEICIDAIRP